ncbi:MAG: diaminopimelate dehydrogenase [Clostridiales bacterium]|nr:diaminopimelate dehydrogenase [Clostridiales bacterium]
MANERYSDTIRVGIVGYGNLGKGAELAVKRNPDFDLVTVFAKRSLDQIEEMKQYIGQIDFMLLCVGSSVDLPKQAPEVVKLFNTVDTFDTHAKIPEYFASMDEAAKQADHMAMISTGWDPGLFSLMRGLMEPVLPGGASNTFWGWGVSQGHGEAIKRIPGVQIARAYTIPVESTLEEVRAGGRKAYTPRQMHKRDCYVVAEENADLESIRAQIVSMPNYFEPNDTEVTFVDMETFQKEHNVLPHGGSVIRSGDTGEAPHQQVMEFSLKLESNPEFTASVMLSFCRAARRMYAEGRRGAVTALDVPVGYLSTKGDAALRKELL